jgi:hypothetical protein
MSLLIALQTWSRSEAEKDGVEMCLPPMTQNSNKTNINKSNLNLEVW